MYLLKRRKLDHLQNNLYICSLKIRLMAINSTNLFKFYALILLIFTTGSLKAQSDSTLIAYLKNLKIETTHHNQLKLLKSGEEKFIDLFQKIEEAKHHVHLEYFNFRNDSIANALFELLAKKAKEGVEIRAIFDAFGNFSHPSLS